MQNENLADPYNDDDEYDDELSLNEDDEEGGLCSALITFTFKSCQFGSNIHLQAFIEIAI